MMEYQDIIKRSVDSLQRIYAVVVALAITIAIQKVLPDYYADFTPWKTMIPSAPSLIAFIFTIVPFYHGMNRHLDGTYVEKKVNKEGFLLGDFFVFFIESCLLVAMASLVASKDYVFLILMTLLCIDTLWAFICHGIHYGGLEQSTYKWGIINAIAIVILWLFYFSNWFSGIYKSWALSLVAVVRTCCDYTFCWRFYFPSKQT